jgi:hypothetical protein
MSPTIPGAPSSEVVAEALRIRPGVAVVLISAYSRGMAPPLGLPYIIKKQIAPASRAIRKLTVGLCLAA